MALVNLPSSAVTALLTFAIASLAAVRPSRSLLTSTWTVARLRRMCSTSDSILAIRASIAFSSGWSSKIGTRASLLRMLSPPCPFVARSICALMIIVHKFSHHEKYEEMPRNTADSARGSRARFSCGAALAARACVSRIRMFHAVF